MIKYGRYFFFTLVNNEYYIAFILMKNNKTVIHC